MPVLEVDLALCDVQGNILLSIGSPKALIVAADLFVVSPLQNGSASLGLFTLLYPEMIR